MNVAGEIILIGECVPTSKEPEVPDSSKWNETLVYGSRITWLVLRSYLNIVGSVLIVAYLLCPSLCMLREDAGRAYIISTFLLGCALANFFLIFVNMKFEQSYCVSACFKWTYLLAALVAFPVSDCKGDGDLYAMGPTQRTDYWTSKLTSLRSSILIAFCAQYLICIFAMKYMISIVRPATLAITAILMGLAVFKTQTIQMAASSQFVFFATLGVACACYMLKLQIRKIGESNCRLSPLKAQTTPTYCYLYPALLGAFLAWTICCLFSSTLLKNHTQARTDIFTGIYNYVSQYWFPYPEKWGLFTFDVSTMLVMLSVAVIAVIELQLQQRLTHPQDSVESLSNVALMECACNLISFIPGMGLGLQITKFEGKLENFMVTNCICSLLLFGTALSSYICASLSTIPYPIVAAFIFAAFSMQILKGLKMKYLVDTRQPRNVFVLGTSLLIGFATQELTSRGIVSFRFVGVGEIEQILMSICACGFLIGAIASLLLDNFVPMGTVHEYKWDNKPREKASEQEAGYSHLNGNSHCSLVETESDICSCCLSTVFL